MVIDQDVTPYSCWILTESSPSVYDFQYEKQTSLDMLVDVANHGPIGSVRCFPRIISEGIVSG